MYVGLIYFIKLAQWDKIISTDLRVMGAVTESVVVKRLGVEKKGIRSFRDLGTKGR